MEQIPLPKNITSQETGQYRAKIMIEPCYPGYGTTLGNSLRRVLLSSLPGSAISAVKVNGVDHEFSTLPGVVEDMVDIILNIKQIRLKVYASEPVKLHLKVSGEKKVTAGDISVTSDVKILNPDLILMTLTDKKASVEMEFVAQSGRGYVPVEARDKEKLDIGVIAIDAIYTPVIRVGYVVENVRVGQMTNYEKLTMDVETDGSLSPLEAVKEASRILIDHFQVIIGDFITENKYFSEQFSEQSPREEEFDDVKVVKKRGRPRKDI